MLNSHIKISDIHINTGCKVKEITENAVIYKNPDGKQVTLPCDKVVMAAGFKTDKTLENALRECVEELFVIGDAVSPRKIYTAVHEGFHTARLL